MARMRLMGLIVMVIILAGVILWWQQRSSDLVWQRIQRGNVLHIAVDPSFPPFEYLDEQGQIIGFDVAFAQELGRRLGVDTHLSAIAFDGLVDAVLAGKADVVISAYPYDPRLTDTVRFSAPYFEGGLVLVARPSDRQPEPSLADSVVAVEWGSLGDAWARRNDLLILRTETSAEALQAVSDGRAELAVVDAVTAALMPFSDFSILTPPVESDPYVIVMAGDAPKLAEAVNEVILQIMADGTWDRLVGDYFYRQPPLPPLP